MIDAISSSLAANPRVKEISEQGTRDGATMQMDDFLQLLTAQIANQDPLEPMKDTEFISQMANIASLEQMQQFSKGFENFADSHKDMVTQAYLGRKVNIEDEGKSISGIVDAVNKAEDGEVTVQVNGKDYSPENISRVSLSGVSN
jgi:flagellar basal-body rod modification protein FlgD